MDESPRRALIEQHLDLPRRVAAVLHGRCREYVELDELVAVGNTGLAEAAARFDSSLGVPFRTFAYYRVQGAMVDALRKLTTLPRRVWANLVALRAASELLEQRAHRDAGAVQQGAPSRTVPEELDAVRDALGAIRTVYLTSLTALDEREPASADEPVDAALERKQRAAQLRSAIDSLPDRERQLMVKHYWEGKNLLEAGDELGISKSWASRLHAQAVARLRVALEDES